MAKKKEGKQLTFTREQIANIRKCTVQYVTMSKLPKEPDGNYSLDNPVVYEFVGQRYCKEAVAQYIREQKTKDPEKKLDNPMLEKARLDSIHVEKKIRKLDLEFEKAKKNIIPVELAEVYIGAFSSGVSSNFLNIGKRVAKNDKTLEEKINSEIGLAIRKTKDGAKKALRNESERIKMAIRRAEENEESEPEDETEEES